MIQFTYSFCMAIFHSLWQAALMLLLYIAVDKILLPNNSPLAKRNFLFVILFSQVLLFILSFFIFFSGNLAYSSIASIGQSVTDFLGTANIQAAAPWIFVLYVLVICYKLIQAVYLWFNFAKQYKYGLQKPAIELKLFTQLKAHQFGIKRKVKLWLSSTSSTPVTFGFFKPVILLPVALVNNISTQQAETLILHELTHIRTNDYLLNWFLIFIENIFFFNPFISRLCGKLRMEREKNCDMNVMAFEYTPALYAETLLQAERIKQLVPSFQLAAVNRKKQLLYRIRFFSNAVDLNKNMRFNMVAPLVGLALVLILSSAILFQSGNKHFVSTGSGFIPYIPFNSVELLNTEFANSPSPVSHDAEIPARENEKQKALIEKLIKKSEAEINNSQQQAEIVSKQIEENSIAAGLAMPVATKENDAAKQIIIQEESSGSNNASLKVYYLSFENGQWILTPEWILSAKEIPADSLLKKINTNLDSIKKVLPPQQ